MDIALDSVPHQMSGKSCDEDVAKATRSFKVDIVIERTVLGLLLRAISIIAENLMLISHLQQLYRCFSECQYSSTGK